jgi:hypothetical protein
MRMKLWPECIFYLWTIQMQIFEYFIHMNPTCGLVNYGFTKFGLIINHLEPLALYAGICVNGTADAGVHLTAILYSAVATAYVCQAWIVSHCTIMTEASFPHLQWLFNYAYGSGIFYPFFVIILVALSVRGIPGRRGRIHGLVCALSWIASHFLYGFMRAAGQLWCLAAAFAPWLLPGVYDDNLVAWLGMLCAIYFPHVVDIKLLIDREFSA